MESNVWGAGGLFEKALASKLNRQDSAAAADTQNAAANMLNVTNQYDLGLRRDANDRSQLDISRGRLDLDRGQLDVNRAGAFTNQFNADTQRLNMSQGLRGPVNSATASNLGLSTVRPPAAAASSTSTPSLRLGANMFGDKPFGMKNGGLALKPKMVKQPGYMHGGKVTVPKGYKAGGRIGHAKNDDGTDKVPVMARHGEYYLSPEMVINAFGKGSYNQGVRVLDQAVRDFTGKEPGPVPVGKSGKPGFAASGALALIPGEGPRQIPVAGTAMVPIEGTARTGHVPNWTVPPPQGQAAAAAAPRMIDVTPSRGMAFEAGRALRNALPSAQAVKSAAGTVAAPAFAGAEGLANMNSKTDFYNSPDVPTLEKAKQSLRDLARPTATAVGGIIGTGAGTVASPSLVVNPVTGAIAGAAAGRAMVSGIDEEGDAYKAFRAANPRQAPAAPAKDAKAAESKEGQNLVRVNGQWMTQEQFTKHAEDLDRAEAARKPSMREFYMNQLQELKNEDARLGGVFGAQLRNQLENTIMTKLADVSNAEATNAKSAVAANEKFQQETDDRIDKHFTMTQVDDKGKTTKVPDPDQARAFREHMGKLGKDVYQTPRAEQDKLAREFALSYRANQGANSILAEEGGNVSDTMDTWEIDPNGVGFGAAATYKGITAMDGLRSWLPWTSDMTNVLMRNRVTGEAVPASRQFALRGGGFDYEAFRQAQRDDNALLKLMAEAKKQQAK